MTNSWQAYWGVFAIKKPRLLRGLLENLQGSVADAETPRDSFQSHSLDGM